MQTRVSVKIVASLFFFVFIAIVLALVMEIAFRMKNVYPVAGIQYSSTEIWHWHKNLHSITWDEENGNFMLHTDKFGFRNYDKDYNKSDSVFRILIIGDSYTAGLTQTDDKVFTSLLEQKLSDTRTGGKRIEVFNMASPAWGAEQQFLCLKNYGLFAKPDYVLIMTCPNDIRETYCKHFAYLDSGEIKFGPVPFRKIEIFKWKLACYSHLYQYLQKNLFKTSYGSFEMLMGKFRFNFGKEDSVNWDRPMFLKHSFPELDEAWKLYFTILDNAKKLCGEHNIPIAVSSTPFVMEYDGSMQADTAMQPGLVAEKINEHCRQEGMPYVNLYQHFKADSNPVSFFRSGDKHFDGRGHEAAAEGLAAFFKSALH